MRVEQLLNPLSLLVCKSGCLDLIFLLVALVIERADAVRDRYRAFRFGNLSGDSLELAALKTLKAFRKNILICGSRCET